MTMTAVGWTGLGLAFLAAFLLSLFHVVLGAYSKISLSRFLEDRDKAERTRVLDAFEETVLAVEFLRVAVIVALVVYAFVAFRSAGLRPFAVFVAALAVYALVLDLVPRLLVFTAKAVILRMFLPAFGAIRTML